MSERFVLDAWALPAPLQREELAAELDATLLTGDPELELLRGEVRIEKLSRIK